MTAWPEPSRTTRRAAAPGSCTAIGCGFSVTAEGDPVGPSGLRAMPAMAALGITALKVVGREVPTELCDEGYMCYYREVLKADARPAARDGRSHHGGSRCRNSGA